MHLHQNFYLPDDLPNNELTLLEYRNRNLHYYVQIPDRQFLFQEVHRMLIVHCFLHAVYLLPHPAAALRQGFLH